MLFCDVGGVVFGSIIITIFDIVSCMAKTTAATLNCMGSSLYGSTGQSTGVHLIWWHVGTRGRHISSFIAKQRVHFVGLSCSVSEGVAVGIAPDMGSIIAASVKYLWVSGPMIPKAFETLNSFDPRHVQGP